MLRKEVGRAAIGVVRAAGNTCRAPPLRQASALVSLDASARLSQPKKGQNQMVPLYQRDCVCVFVSFALHFSNGPARPPHPPPPSVLATEVLVMT